MRSVESTGMIPMGSVKIGFQLPATGVTWQVIEVESTTVMFIQAMLLRVIEVMLVGS